MNDSVAKVTQATSTWQHTHHTRFQLQLQVPPQDELHIFHLLTKTSPSVYIELCPITMIPIS